jgi:hypothetical protein
VRRPMVGEGCDGCSPRLVVDNLVLLGVPQDGDGEPSLVLRVNLEVVLAHKLGVEGVLARDVGDSVVLGGNLALSGGVSSVGVADGRIEAAAQDKRSASALFVATENIVGPTSNPLLP